MAFDMPDGLEKKVGPLKAWHWGAILGIFLVAWNWWGRSKTVPGQTPVIQTTAQPSGSDGIRPAPVSYPTTEMPALDNNAAWLKRGVGALGELAAPTDAQRILQQYLDGTQMTAQDKQLVDTVIKKIGLAPDGAPIAVVKPPDPITQPKPEVVLPGQPSQTTNPIGGTIVYPGTPVNNTPTYVPPQPKPPVVIAPAPAPVRVISGASLDARIAQERAQMVADMKAGKIPNASGASIDAVMAARRAAYVKQMGG